MAWLEQHYPQRKERVLGRIREVRDGSLNDQRFGSRMRGEGPWADLFSRMFKLHKRRLGFSEDRAGLSADHFTNGRMKQGKLFD